jgi:hypothetical protein
LQASNIKVSSIQKKEAGELPDIYYIILDRYSRADVLEEFYDFDNSDFTDYLSDRGFYVARQSNANYLCTAHSLASSLNLQHITCLQGRFGDDSDDWTPVYTMLQDYELVRFMKLQGYNYIHIGPQWYPTSRNRNADIHYNISVLPEFSKLVFETTLFYPIARQLGIIESRAKEKYQRVPYQFDRLAEVPKMKEPTFVFAHFLLPHDPYVFDADGQYVSPEQGSSRSKRDAFIGQLCFLNRELKRLIDTLLLSARHRDGHLVPHH